MADSKITALTALTAADPVNDMFPVVDVSDTSMAASGTTKKISVNNILSSSPTASGALTVTGLVTAGSATITGDLTVDTSTLKVDSANNKVGIGTTTIASTLTIRGTLQTNADYNLQSYYKDNGSTWLGYHLFRDDGVNYLTVLSAQPWALLINGSERYRIASDGVATWSNVGGVAGTSMTLNSTGLGVGGSPAAKISCAGYSSANQLPDINIARSSSGTAIQTGPNIVFTDGTSNNSVTLQNSQGRFGIWNYGAGAWNERLSVDSSGNVGIGVTPSAWASSYKALQFGQSASVSGFSSELAVFGSNCYFDTTDSRWERITSGFTSQYYQTNGTHVWRIGGTAGANTDCSFTQAMTLDASGRLIVNSSTFVPPTLNTNGELNFLATSNTNVRFSYRGTDGVTRVANITLA